VKLGLQEQRNELFAREMHVIRQSVISALFLLLFALLAGRAQAGQVNTGAPLFGRGEKFFGQLFVRLFRG